MEREKQGRTLPSFRREGIEQGIGVREKLLEQSHARAVIVIVSFRNHGYESSKS